MRRVYGSANRASRGPACIWRLSSPDQSAVRAFHAAALAAGAKDNGAPGPRDFAPNYYAAFVIDPDGNNIEAASRGA